MDRIFLIQILESGDPAFSELMVFFVKFEGLKALFLEIQILWDVG